MADKPVKKTTAPHYEIRDVGPGFCSTHIWPGDGTHESDNIIYNDERVFNYGVLAINEEITVTRGRLIVICMNPAGNEASTACGIETGGTVKLQRGNCYRFVAVGLTQYHCKYGPEEETTEEVAQGADEAPAPPREQQAPTVFAHPPSLLSEGPYFKKTPLDTGTPTPSSSGSGTRTGHEL